MAEVDQECRGNDPANGSLGSYHAGSNKLGRAGIHQQGHQKDLQDGQTLLDGHHTKSKANGYISQDDGGCLFDTLYEYLLTHDSAHSEKNFMDLGQLRVNGLLGCDGLFQINGYNLIVLKSYHPVLFAL